MASSVAASGLHAELRAGPFGVTSALPCALSWERHESGQERAGRIGVEPLG